MIKPEVLELPQKFTEFRPGQVELAAKVAASQKFVYLLDAPTGCGKSLVAATAQRIFGRNVVYLVMTKQLQDQILTDFPYAKTLKGRSNYVCARAPKMFPTISAETCTNTESNPCDYTGECAYLVAKREALSAPLAVLNMAYFLSEANFVGGFSGRKFVVVDEADMIEDQLMSFIELVVTQRQLSRYQLPTPKFKTKYEAWLEWAKATLSMLTPVLARLENESQRDDWGGIDYRVLRELKYVERLVGKLKYFIREVDNTWVWYPSEGQWTFKPTWVSKYANAALWDHMEKALCMSATILDPKQFCINTGVISKVGRMFDYARIDSPFPVEHRPVYVNPVANVINKQMDVALPRLASAITNLLGKYPNDKVLVHTVSYKIRDYLLNNIRTDRLITHSTSDRATVLEGFKKSTRPLALLSPSMDRGVDLPNDECRVVIIAKLPYPDLGDSQISKRVYSSGDGNQWYAYKTVSTVIQMSGRAVRSAEDYADTYILDAQFQKLYTEHKSLFPEWYRRAIVM